MLSVGFLSSGCSASPKTCPLYPVGGYLKSYPVVRSGYPHSLLKETMLNAGSYGKRLDLIFNQILIIKFYKICQLLFGTRGIRKRVQIILKTSLSLEKLFKEKKTKGLPVRYTDHCNGPLRKSQLNE